MTSRRLAQLFCSGMLAFATTGAFGDTSAKPDPETWLGEAEIAYDRVTGYTAVVHKQQRVSGELLPEETIFLKYRKPLSVYMKWIKAPYKGSELLYVAGWNENQVRAHRGGILRFVTRNLDPKDPGLMAGNLRPVTSMGVGFLLEAVSLNMRKAIKRGELAFSERAPETVYGRKTRALEATFPKDMAKEYDGCRFVINQDIENKILVRIRIYDRDDRLIENYGYENLVLNAPLADADFDAKNPDYHF